MFSIVNGYFQYEISKRKNKFFKPVVLLAFRKWKK